MSLGIGIGLPFSGVLSQGFIEKFAPNAPAYSLASLSNANKNVVEVTRLSDDSVMDFKSPQLIDGTLLNWVVEDGNIYISDFSSTEDLTESNGTGSAAQSVGGEDDAYKFTLTGGSSTHYTYPLVVESSKDYTVSLKYYVPSSNSAVDGIRVRTNDNGDGGTNFNVQDSWESIELSFDDIAGVQFRIYANDGGVSTIDADGDVFYLKDIVITQTDADGVVTTIYDQCLDTYHVTQSNTDYCPLIVEEGALITKNGLPALKVDGNDDILSNTDWDQDQPFSFILTAGISGGCIWSGRGGASDALVYEGGTNQFVIDSGVGIASTVDAVNGKQQLWSGIVNGASSSIRLNRSENNTGNCGTDNIEGINLFSAGTNRWFDGYWQETIFFNSDRSSDIEDIELNRGRYWYNLPVSTANIFLQGGQSNSDGRADTSSEDAPSYLSDNVVDGVKVYNDTALMPYSLTDTGRNGNGSSISGSGQSIDKFSFGDVALKQLNDTLGNVVLCKVTQGDTPLWADVAALTSLGSWNADYGAVTGGKLVLLEELENRLASLISLFNAFDVSFEVKALLWHQGENDSVIAGAPAAYQTNWQAVVNKVRSFSDVSSTLPIIHGTIPTASDGYNSTIESAMETVAAADSNIFLRDNSVLPLQIDDLHFDAEGCVTFGDWAYNTYIENYG